MKKIKSHIIHYRLILILLLVSFSLKSFYSFGYETFNSNKVNSQKFYSKENQQKTNLGAFIYQENDNEEDDLTESHEIISISESLFFENPVFINSGSIPVLRITIYPY